MQSPDTFYKEQLAVHNLNVKKAKKSLIQFSLIRLVVFVVASFGIYFTLDKGQVAIVIGIVGLVIFLLLLKKYGKVKYEEQLSKALVHINEEEINIASGDFYNREPGLKT
jgi:membrane protein YdbS with pleckstrin-like domain